MKESIQITLEGYCGINLAEIKVDFDDSLTTTEVIHSLVQKMNVESSDPDSKRRETYKFKKFWSKYAYDHADLGMGIAFITENDLHFRRDDDFRKYISDGGSGINLRYYTYSSSG